MTAKVFRSFRELKFTLGRLDAAHELTELALRHLDDSAPSPAKYEDYVFQLAVRFGLHVRPHSSREAHRVVVLSGIATVHACYEEFLISLASELLQFDGVDLQLALKGEGVSKHEHVVATLKKARLLLAGDKFGVLDQVMHLLRLIRNSQAHRGREAPKRIEDLRAHLHASPHWQQVFPHRAPPCDYDSLGFSDFLLFTQGARDTAEFLARLLLPSPQAIANHKDFKGYIGSGGIVTDGERLRYLADRFALDETAARAVLCFA